MAPMMSSRSSLLTRHLAVLGLSLSALTAFAARGPESDKKSAREASQSWPQFRGLQATGLAKDQTPPTTWDTETGTNLSWKTAIPGLSHSSPVVWNHETGTTVYVTTAVGEQSDASFKHGLYGSGDASGDRTKHRFMVMALNAKDGSILWQTTVQHGVPQEKRHIKATYANQTPATNGKVIVAFFGSEGLYGLDIKGNVLWRADVGRLDVGAYDAPTYEWGSASSPIIFEDLAIVQCDTQGKDFLLAVDLATGKERWRTPRQEQPSWGTPTALPATSKHPAVLVANGSTFIIGYNPSSGKELWRLGGSSNITAPTPFAAGDDLIVVASGRRPSKPIYVLQRGATGDLTLADGESSSEHIVWSSTGKGPYMPTPVALGNRLFVLQNQGILDAYELSTGKELFRERLRHQGGGFSGSPVIAGDTLYLPSEDGEIFVVRAGDEYQEVAINSIGERLMSTPAIANDTLFVKGEHHLFAFAQIE